MQISLLLLLVCNWLRARESLLWHAFRTDHRNILKICGLILCLKNRFTLHIFVGSLEPIRNELDGWLTFKSFQAVVLLLNGFPTADLRLIAQSRLVDRGSQITQLWPRPTTLLKLRLQILLPMFNLILVWFSIELLILKIWIRLLWNWLFSESFSVERLILLRRQPNLSTLLDFHLILFATFLRRLKLTVLRIGGLRWTVLKVAVQENWRCLFLNFPLIRTSLSAFFNISV